MSAHQYDEGHTVAGWTGFGIATVGTSVVGLGVCMVSVPVLAVGLAIVVGSVLVTWALHLTGWRGAGPGGRVRPARSCRCRWPRPGSRSRRPLVPGDEAGGGPLGGRCQWCPLTS